MTAYMCPLLKQLAARARPAGTLTVLLTDTECILPTGAFCFVMHVAACVRWQQQHAQILLGIRNGCMHSPAKAPPRKLLALNK